MLVDLIELYCAGQKLPRAAWRAQPRVRGELSIHPYASWHGHDRAPACATLRPFGLVEDLDKVKVSYMSGRNVVLFGQQRLDGRTLEQMWWCKIV